MTARRQAIFAAIETRLTAIGDAVETKTMPSADPGSFPARHVFDSGQRLTDSDVLSSRYELDVTVEGYLEQSGGAGAHAALNDLYVATVKALLGEPPLGGLAETIDEGDLRVTVAPLASARRLAFSLDLTITFTNRRGDPAQAA